MSDEKEEVKESMKEVLAPMNYLGKDRSPITDRFKFIPRFNPILSGFVTGVSWDCAEKTLKVIIRETPTFAAYKWFGHLNERHDQMVKSPFSDSERDGIIMILYDSENREVVKVKFLNVTLDKHKCELGRFNPYYSNVPVEHEIMLQYEECRHFQSHEEDIIVDANQISDEEWRTYEAV